MLVLVFKKSVTSLSKLLGFIRVNWRMLIWELSHVCRFEVCVSGLWGVCVQCNPTLCVCVCQVWSWSVWMKSWGRRCINVTLQVITAALRPQQPEWNRLKPSASWRRKPRRNTSGPSSRPSRCSNHEAQLPPGRRTGLCEAATQ